MGILTKGMGAILKKIKPVAPNVKFRNEESKKLLEKIKKNKKKRDKE